MKEITQQVVVLFVFSLLFILNFSQVQAHVLESDQTIGAVIHIDPDDDPIAGRVSTFYFDFKDKTGRFTPQECECVVTIYQGEDSIYTQSMYDHENQHDEINPSLSSPSFSYTFWKKNIYRVELVGKPRSEGDFDEFVLSYDVRVEREDPSIGTQQQTENSYADGESAASPMEAIENYLPVILAVVIIVAMISLFYLFLSYITLT